MTLKEITKNILCEGVSNNEIESALRNHKYVNLTYTDREGVNMGARMVQIAAWGCTTAGNDVIRVFEPFGGTRTSVPNWKYILVNGITSWKETDKTFDELPPNFNPNGDKSMSVVYMVAKFDNNGEMSDAPTSSPKMKSDEKPELYRTDTERKMEKLRKQLNNPLTLSDYKIQKGFGDSNMKGLKSGPKTNRDAKKGTDDVYTDEYNYNTFDNALAAAGKKTKRNGNYYFQKRNNGKFTKGSVLDDEPMVDDTAETEEYLNKDNGNITTIEDLRKAIGDTKKPISLRELQDLLKNKK